MFTQNFDYLYLNDTTTSTHKKFQKNCKNNHIYESLKTLEKFAKAFTFKGLFNSLELFVKVYKNICAYKKFNKIARTFTYINLQDVISKHVIIITVEKNKNMLVEFGRINCFDIFHMFTSFFWL